MEPVSDPPDDANDAICTALDQVGSRLRQIRTYREITLI